MDDKKQDGEGVKEKTKSQRQNEGVRHSIKATEKSKRMEKSRTKRVSIEKKEVKRHRGDKKAEKEVKGNQSEGLTKCRHSVDNQAAKKEAEKS